MSGRGNYQFSVGRETYTLCSTFVGYYPHLFLVPKNIQFRPLFNTKPLNQFIVARSFKMAILMMVVGPLCPGDFVVSLDPLDPYFHVRIMPGFRHFLHYKFRGHAFQFRAMPFGLSSASHIFTRLTRCVSLFCWKMGFHIIFYLDDTISMATVSHIWAFKHRLCGHLALLTGVYH